MGHPETMLALIQQERAREIAAAERARLVSGRADPRSGRDQGLRPRRHLGRALIRVGIWLAISGTPALRR